MPVDAAIIALIFLWYCSRFGPTIIVEARVIVTPCDTSKSAPANHLRVIGAIVNTPYPIFLPVAAATRRAIRQQPAILAQATSRQRHRPILAQRIGIENNRWFALQRFLHIQHRLVLQPI